MGGKCYWGKSTTIQKGASGSTTIHRGEDDDKAQQRVMEMERCESKAIAKRRHVILDRATLLEKGIKILNPNWFMWT